MTQNQKRAWGNLVVWGAYLIAAATFLASHGTVFFWHEDAIRTGFYIITGAAVAAWFVMMFTIWITRPRAQIVSDERDDQIMSRVNAAAGPIALTAVALVSLALMIAYLEDRNSTMSPYLLIYIVMVNTVAYWLAQAFITLVAYRKS